MSDDGDSQMQDDPDVDDDNEAVVAGMENAEHEEEADDEPALRGLHWFLAKPSSWRRSLIREPWSLPVAAMHLAAFVIQQAADSRWNLRKKAAQLTAQQAAKERKSPSNKIREVLRHRYLFLMQRQLEMRFSGGVGNMNQKTSAYASFEHFCAALIQSAWRAKFYDHVNNVKRVLIYKKRTLFQVAAYEIQCAYRSFRQRRTEESKRFARQRSEEATTHSDERHAAATKLQRSWRKTNDYKMYMALKEIIGNFNGAGDPCMLLRSIAPREAQMLDPAMQVHVRFRLGGEHFPPSIYYKIFSHGKIVDLCAFAPRDYAAVRSNLPEYQHEWYMRVERNGWRPIAMRLYKKMDDIEKSTAQRAQPNFHHNRLQRRQDLERKRKHQKVRWMQKLYQLKLQGPLARDPEGPQTERRLREDEVRSSQSMRSGSRHSDQSVGSDSAEVVYASHDGDDGRSDISSEYSRQQRRQHMDGASEHSDDREEYFQEQWRTQPIDEDPMSDEMLLEWTKKLDFDSYMDSWARIATSDISEGILPIGSARAHPSGALTVR
jgi:hypothetical protein